MKRFIKFIPKLKTNQRPYSTTHLLRQESTKLKKIEEDLEKDITKKLDDYVPPLKVDDAKGLTEKHVKIINTWLEKSYGENELYMAEVEHSHIENVMQRTFFKTVALWKADAGATRKGYKEFISAMVYSVKVFEVDQTVDAYLELIDCFPQSKHTGIKRKSHIKAAFAERFADHELGEIITLRMMANGCIPDGKYRDKILAIFGQWSPVYVAVDNVMFWQPRFQGYHLSESYDSAIVRPHEKVDPIKDPVKSSFLALRQMAPGIHSKMQRFSIESSLEQQLIHMQKQSEIKIKEEDLPPFEARMLRESVQRKAFSNAVISVQSEQMMEDIKNHDSSLPIIVSGPHVVMVKDTRIKYYMIESATGGQIEPFWEDPDKYQKVEYEKWWKDDHKKELVKTVDNLGRLQAVEQRVLPRLDVMKDKIQKDYIQSGWSQLDELEEFEETWEAPSYAICTIGSEDTETALLTWLRSLSLSSPENERALTNSVVMFQRSAIENSKKNEQLDASKESNTLIRQEDIPRDCFLGTAPAIMPRVEELDNYMIGVEAERDFQERQNWGDEPNADIFQSWEDHVPELPQGPTQTIKIG